MHRRWNPSRHFRAPIGCRCSLKYPIAVSCHLSLHAFYRSILVLTSLANMRADQSQRRVPPAPEWPSHLSGQRRILFTQPRSTLEDERYLWISFLRLYFPVCIFPPHLSAFHRAILIWGIETWLGAVPRTNRMPTTRITHLLQQPNPSLTPLRSSHPPDRFTFLPVWSII